MCSISCLICESQIIKVICDVLALAGLGSRLCEEIRAEFPVSHILTVSVVPHQSGESPLQHYNTLLSLAALHR